MNEKRKTHISKFLSLILRHKPETVGLTLDSNGWIEVERLLAAIAKNGNSITREEIEEVVTTSEKKRFAFNENKTKIRANQGHSIKVQVEFEERTPPKSLYHGTAERNVKSIQKQGLIKMRRHHVHLSGDIETAINVGKRYGKPVVFKINVEEMLKHGYKFYVSVNDVWLIENVPPEFLEIV